jgi:hypothetical protein
MQGEVDATEIGTKVGLFPSGELLSVDDCC